MSIIHSSSLAYKPVAYNPPQTGRDVGGATASSVIVDDKTNTGQNSQASSTQQIKTALGNAGLLNADTQNQSNNLRTQKAIKAYTQNLNLSAKLQIAETISGIDTYA